MQLLSRLVDLDEILYEDDDNEDDLDTIVINPIASHSWIWMKFCLKLMALSIVYCKPM
jgi:hypothetical protein